MTRTALLLVGAVAGTLALAGCAAEAPSATIHQVATSAAADAGTLDAAAFAAVVDEPGTVILDVRTPGEFTSGHIAGARNLDVADPAFTDRVAELPQDGRYAVYCRSGNRSAQALAMMREAGITGAVHLDGGISTWEAWGGEVVTD